MFGPAPHAKIWLDPTPADMRCSYQGLIKRVVTLGHKPTSGDYFVFINRRLTQLKILYFEPDGYAIWQKRLEQGQWAKPKQRALNLPLSRTELELILSGLKIEKAWQHKRFHLSSDGYNTTP